MAETHWTDDELRLIERLGRAPQPELNPAQVEVMKMSILNNVPVVPTPPPTPFAPWLVALGGGLAGVVATIIVVVVVIIQPGGSQVPPIEQTLTAVATFLPTATPTATLPTATPTPTLDPSVTVSPVVPTATVNATSVTPVGTLTANPTVSLTPATPVGTVTASPTPGGEIIIIEGPVTNININIITIYNFTIVVGPNDPVLTTIRIGDIIRVEGNIDDDGGQIVIIAITIINITIINLPPNQGGGEWTDDGGCENGPPPWAPAHGWRRRCGGGGDNDDDDDDDDD
jgi:hypothetical protein